MADLHNKLAMRRKGISGAKENDASGSAGGAPSASNMIDRISSMIPPPPKASNESNTEASEDDEWD